MDRCERCNKYQANVHIVKVFDGIKKEVNICEKCAKELGEFNLNSILDVDNTFSLNILSGLVEYFNNNQPSSVVKVNDSECSKCKTTYAEIKNSGFLGCDECYKQFAKILAIFIKRVQKGMEHIGKIPSRCGGEVIKRKELNELKDKLQKAILSEEYERAAELRDLIRKMENDIKEDKQ